MKTRLTVLALVVAAVIALGGATGNSAGAPSTGGSPDAYVTDWDAVGVQACGACIDGFPLFAYVGMAVYDAVTAIEGGYQPFVANLEAPAGASPQAAVVAAAHSVLLHYLPNQTQMLDDAYLASLATIPGGQARDDGVATGEKAAAAVIAARAGDGLRNYFTYTPPDPPIPGVWIPTAPIPAIGTDVSRMRPFVLASADQFRPNGPPPLGSKRWAQDYDEVKEIGSATSTTRTDEQTRVARFWAEPPLQQGHNSLRKFVLDRGLDVLDAARFMAMASLVDADAQIACFDAKYHYLHWRPITAIRAGDTDGNDATVADPGWTPLLATPNHPEYPAAHVCITPARMRAIARFLGTSEIDFTIPSLTGLGDRHYQRVGDLENEIMNARIWGGIHFRSSVEDGRILGMKVADYVLAHAFHRVDE
jgi:VCPO second helical-bundle domain